MSAAPRIRLRRAATALALVLLGLASAYATAGAPGAAAASRFCQNLRNDLASGGGHNGLVVRNLRNGKTVCSSGANRKLILASNTKLFTTATALVRLRPKTRIPTTVWQVGELRPNGTLRGDLYLKGAGDPALAMPAFGKIHRPRVTTNLVGLRAGIRRAGIKRVTGRLYADDSIFDRKRGVPDSGWNTSPYIGPLSGLALNSGFTGKDAKFFAFDPAILAAEKLAASLRKAGIRFGGGIKLGKRPPIRRVSATSGEEPELIARVKSPPVRLLAEQTNVHSDNFFAETLLKLIGARVAGRGSTEGGARVVMRLAGKLGADLQAVDGSGLSRGNVASAKDVADFLEAMSERPIGEVFRSTLPLTGRDGTVADRTNGSPADRRCEVKTGTLTGVSALSGYCTTKSGREIAFSILMNSVASSTAARHYQDKIIGRLAGV